MLIQCLWGNDSQPYTVVLWCIFAATTLRRRSDGPIGVHLGRSGVQSQQTYTADVDVDARSPPVDSDAVAWPFTNLPPSTLVSHAVEAGRVPPFFGSLSCIRVHAPIVRNVPPTPEIYSDAHRQVITSKCVATFVGLICKIQDRHCIKTILTWREIAIFR